MKLQLKIEFEMFELLCSRTSRFWSSVYSVTLFGLLTCRSSLNHSPCWLSETSWEFACCSLACFSLQYFSLHFLPIWNQNTAGAALLLLNKVRVHMMCFVRNYFLVFKKFASNGDSLKALALQAAYRPAKFQLRTVLNGCKLELPNSKEPRR